MAQRRHALDWSSDDGDVDSYGFTNGQRLGANGVSQNKPPLIPRTLKKHHLLRWYATPSLRRAGARLQSAVASRLAYGTF